MNKNQQHFQLGKSEQYSSRWAVAAGQRQWVCGSRKWWLDNKVAAARAVIETPKGKGWHPKCGSLKTEWCRCGAARALVCVCWCRFALMSTRCAATHMERPRQGTAALHVECPLPAFTLYIGCCSVTPLNVYCQEEKSQLAGCRRRHGRASRWGQPGGSRAAGGHGAAAWQCPILVICSGHNQ